jgi:hypothetical protein
MEKNCETPAPWKKAEHRLHNCNPIYIESENTKIKVQTDLSKKQGLISKITRLKRAGGVAQVIECLLPKLRALCSNSIAAQCAHTVQ